MANNPFPKANNGLRVRQLETHTLWLGMAVPSLAEPNISSLVHPGI